MSAIFTDSLKSLSLFNTHIIDIKLLKVNDTFRIADMKLSMMNRDSKNENTLRMPSENYNLLKGKHKI